MAAGDVSSHGGAASAANSIHFHALCSAVEHEKFEKARAILESGSLGTAAADLSRTNPDGFTPLDLAFMTGRQDLLKLVIAHGGRGGGVFPSSEAVSTHLLYLIGESRKQVEKFGQLTSSHSNQVANLSHAQLKECEKQRSLWQKRMSTLKRLRSGFDSSGCPHAPAALEIGVVGPARLCARLREPERMGHSPYTKYKVQWSHTDSFVRIEGEMIVADGVQGLQCNIDGLSEGQR